MNGKAIGIKFKRYFIIMAIWYMIPFVLKYALDICSGWLFLAFVVLYGLYLTSVILWNYLELSEHMRKHYRDHPLRKNMFFRMPFSLIEVVRESKKYADEEFQYKAEKFKQLFLFQYAHILIAWFISLIYLNV